MNKQSLTKLITGMAFMLALLTACGDGNGIHFNIESGGNWPWPWAKNAEFFAAKKRTENVKVADHISLWLDALNGEIEITGQPGASSVAVTAELRVGSESYQDAQAGLDQLEFGITEGYDEISVQTLQPKYSQGRQYIVNYTITIPSDLAVDVNQINGHVTLKDIENSIFVSVVNGNVIFSNVSKDVTVGVDNGNIDGKLIQPPAGEIRLSAANGNLDLRIPSSTSAELSAQVDNGAITWENLDLTGVLQTDQSLHGTLGDGTWLIDLEAQNGDIDLVGFDG
jgi:hypothetical protein